MQDLEEREAHLGPLHGKSAELAEVGLTHAHAPTCRWAHHAGHAQVEIGVKRPHPGAKTGQPALKAPSAPPQKSLY